MKNILARSINIYRKERGLTQEELAQILGLSFQSVSKWENAQSMPDISLLPQLSRTLEVSVVAPPPEKEPNAHKWISGELLTHYQDWFVRDSAEIVFDCNSSGVPHKHAMAKMIAQKIGSLE